MAIIPFFYKLSVVITAAQLDSSKPELRFWAGLNPARGVSEIRDRWGSLTMVRAGNKATPFVGQPYHKKQLIIISQSKIYLFRATGCCCACDITLSFCNEQRICLHSTVTIKSLLRFFFNNLFFVCPLIIIIIIKSLFNVGYKITHTEKFTLIA